MARMDFSDKVVIVTGAAKGIGRAVAELFAERNAKALVLTDINEEQLEKTCKELENGKTRILGYQCDVSDEAKVNEVVIDIIKICGKIDVLVNNAGIYNTSDAFADSKSADWRKKLEINVLGTMYYTRAVINGMIEQKYGRIVNIGSVAGIYGIRKMADYSATKGAIIAFTKALAKEVAPFGVTVNSVSPGGIADKPETSAHLSFMNRSGSPLECAEAILFLASEEASYISGQDLQVDGCRRAM